MLIFTDTPHCRSRLHCQTCRDAGTEGTRQRATWASVGLLAPEVCPFGVNPPPLPPGAAVPIVDPTRPHYTGWDGSKVWASLHAETNPTPAFIDEITASIPCGSCKLGWLVMLQATPPDFSSLEAWRLWTYQRHEQVREKLNQEPWTYAEAAARWNW